MFIAKACWFLLLLLLFACQVLVRGEDQVGSTEEVVAKDTQYVEELITEEEILAKEEIIAEEDEVEWDEDPANMDDVAEAGGICSRLSPKEVFHTDIHPRLLRVLDEMSHFVEAVLDKLEASLSTLLPHLDQPPIGKLSVDELCEELRRFMLGTMKDVYDVIRVAWRELIRAHTYIATPPMRASPPTILRALTTVKEAQKEGEERLVASLKEFSITLKAVLFNSIYSVGVKLKLTNDTSEHEAALEITKTLPEMAPNFLGTLLSSIMQRGSDPELYQKILTNPFRSITPVVDQLYETLETIIENGGGEEAMEDYWRSAVRLAHRHLQDDPLLVENYYVIYQNEEYLHDLVLQLLASF